MSIADQIAGIEVEVHSLRIQVDSLTRSNNYLTQQNSRMEGDILVLANERDTAIRKEAETRQLLESAAALIVNGVRTMQSQPTVRSAVERRQNSAEMLEKMPLMFSQTGGQG